MINIDGIDYDVPVISLKRKAAVLDKFAQRTESGDLEREVIGVYYNYDLQLGMTRDPAEYDRLWDKLTEPIEFHDVVVYDNIGTRTFKAYISNVQDELMRYIDGKGYFNGLQASFVAKLPARTPTGG